MKIIILLTITLALFASCDEPDGVKPIMLNSIDTVEISIHNIKESAWYEPYKEYWAIRNNSCFISDSSWFKDDTLFFRFSYYSDLGYTYSSSFGSVVLNNNNYCISAELKGYYYHIWYDYNKNKWEEGYCNSATEASKLKFKAENFPSSSTSLFFGKSELEKYCDINYCNGNYSQQQDKFMMEFPITSFSDSTSIIIELK